MRVVLWFVVTDRGLPVSSRVQNMRSCEFVKFMFRKINDRIWGGNDRLCSLNRGKRVLFTVSAGWTRHSERDKHRCQRDIYYSRYVDCAIYREVSSAIDRLWRTRAIHQRARYLRSRRLIVSALGPAGGRPRRLNNNIDRHEPPPLAARLLRLDRATASGCDPSRPIATLVYLHLVVAIRRVVGCGRAGPLYVARIRRHRLTVNFVMSKVNNYATRRAFRCWISLKLVGRVRYGIPFLR